MEVLFYKSIFCFYLLTIASCVHDLTEATLLSE